MNYIASWVFFQHLFWVKWPRSTKIFQPFLIIFSYPRIGSQVKCKKSHEIKFQSNDQSDHYFFGYLRRPKAKKKTRLEACFYASETG